MMRKIVTICIMLLFSASLMAQSTEEKTKTTHVNQLKLGFSNQVNVIFSSRYDYDFVYGGRYGNHYSYEGLDFQPYIAYEHIWEFANRTAVGLEPKIGISFKENIDNAFMGLNAKFYWANTDVWMMGIALYNGYGYTNRKISISVPMDGGSYYQRKDVQMNIHSYSFDIGIIPFQFKFRSIPLTVETQFSIAGVTLLSGKSEPYETSSTTTANYIDNYAFTYLLKGEVKIGFVLP